MVCILCNMEEMYQLNGRKILFRHDKDVTSFLCSNCFQRLMQMPQSKIIDAYHSAIEKGYNDKASMLLSFIDEESEDFNDSETREARSDMGRERPLRKARPSRNQFRA